MRALLQIILFVLLAGLGWLLFWPIPLHPQAWQAPKAPGYTGKWASNTDLVGLNTIDLQGHSGPEDVTSRMIDGQEWLFAAVHDGSILKIDPDNGAVSVFAHTGGRPLGLEFDQHGNLIVADAYRGLLSITPDGAVKLLTDSVAGTPIMYADDLDIASDGRIFFSDASTHFSARKLDSTLAASIWALMEHSGDGRLLMYDPHSGVTSVVKDGLNFPNGVAMCPNDICVLVAQTGNYNVLRIWLDGNQAEQVDEVLSNLPGFPDNLNAGVQDTFWVGLTSPRNNLVDKLADKPFLRKIIMRLPEELKPKPQAYGMVIQFGLDGVVLNQLQDPKGAYPTTTGAYDGKDGWLYITSLSAPSLGRKGWHATSKNAPAD